MTRNNDSGLTFKLSSPIAFTIAILSAPSATCDTTKAVLTAPSFGSFSFPAQFTLGGSEVLIPFTAGTVQSPCVTTYRVSSTQITDP